MGTVTRMQEGIRDSLVFKLVASVEREPFVFVLGKWKRSWSDHIGGISFLQPIEVAQILEVAEKTTS